MSRQISVRELADLEERITATWEGKAVTPDTGPRIRLEVEAAIGLQCKVDWEDGEWGQRAVILIAPGTH